MRTRLVQLLLVVFLSSGVTLAQAPQGQMELFYQRIQGFDFDSGSPAFQVEDESFNGGGFGFGYNLNPWLGFYTQTGFFTGVEVPNIKLRLINQVQGVRVTARDLGPLNLFAKAGVGFGRYVFTLPAQETVRFATTFNVGAGTEITMRPGLLLILEANRISMGLPDITGSPARDTRDGAILFTTGIAIQF